MFVHLLAGTIIINIQCYDGEKTVAILTQRGLSVRLSI